MPRCPEGRRVSPNCIKAVIFFVSLSFLLSQSTCSAFAAVAVKHASQKSSKLNDYSLGGRRHRSILFLIAHITYIKLVQ